MPDRDALRDRLEDIEADDEQIPCTNLDVSFTPADEVDGDGLVIDFNNVDT